MAVKAKKRWHCRRCGHMNEPQHVNCRGEDCAGKRRKKPRRRHAEVMRGDTYALFVQANADIHSVTEDECAVCGKLRTDTRKHDRDHDHTTGHPRGLVCGGDAGCNVLMVRWVTAATALGIAEAKAAAGESDATRWFLIAGYLERVQTFYARRAAV